MEEIFRELYKRVGSDFNIEMLETRNFEDFSWTAKDQLEFADWLIDKMNHDEMLHYEVCDHLKCSKQLQIGSVAGEFLLSYGWDIHFDITEIIVLSERGCYGE